MRSPLSTVPVGIWSRRLTLTTVGRWIGHLTAIYHFSIVFIEPRDGGE